MVGGRERVTTDEERVLRGGWAMKQRWTLSLKRQFSGNVSFKQNCTSYQHDWTACMRSVLFGFCIFFCMSVLVLFGPFQNKWKKINNLRPTVINWQNSMANIWKADITFEAHCHNVSVHPKFPEHCCSKYGVDWLCFAGDALERLIFRTPKVITT